MANWRHLLSKWKEPVQKKSNFLVKGTVISTLAVSSLTLGSVKAKTDEEVGLSTVYHVYVGNERVGVVTSKDEIEKWIKTELEKAKEEYKGLEFTLEDQISYVPEQVFQIATQDDSVINILEDQVQVQAEAFAITVNGEPITYVASAELAKQILDALKQAYVSKEELDQLTASNDAAARAAGLTENNDTRLLDVRFTDDVTVSEEMVAPNEILTVDEALKLLQKGTLEEKKYQVQSGDVLGTIAAKHDLTLAQLLKLNPGLKDDSVLQIGQELNVTVYEPMIDVVAEYEQYREEEIPYETKVIEDNTMYKGEQTVKQEGQSGVEAVTYLIREVNGESDGQSVLESKVLSKPVEEIIVKGTKVVPSRGTGDFIWPTVGGYISSQMGYRWNKLHKGLDIARASDLTIKAADNGVVVEAGWDGSYGYKIVIDHNNGYRTVYAHLASINVSAGQTVAQGSKIAVMGSTGDSTGVHLHFELYENGKLVNPLDYY